MRVAIDTLRVGRLSIRTVGCHICRCRWKNSSSSTAVGQEVAVDEIGSISTDTTGKGAHRVGRGLFSQDTEERAE